MVYTIFEPLSEDSYKYYHLTIAHKIIQGKNKLLLTAILEMHGESIYNKIRMDKKSISCLSLALEINAAEAVQLLLQYKAPFNNDEENSLYETANRKQWNTIYACFNVAKKDESIITKERLRKIAHKLWDIAVRQENEDALIFIKEFTNKFHYYHYHFEQEESSQRSDFKFEQSKIFVRTRDLFLEIKWQMGITTKLHAQVLILQKEIEELKQNTTEIDCHIMEESCARTTIENRETTEAQYLFNTLAKVKNTLKHEERITSKHASKVERLQKEVGASELAPPFFGVVVFNRSKYILVLEKIVDLMHDQLKTGNGTSQEKTQELETLISEICRSRKTNRRIDVLISDARALLAQRGPRPNISTLFKKIETINATEPLVEKERIVSPNRFFTQSGDDIFVPTLNTTCAIC